MRPCPLPFSVLFGLLVAWFCASAPRRCASAEPVLALRSAAGGLELVWTHGTAPYVVEQTDALGAPWVVAPGVPDVAGEVSTLRVLPSGQTRYFRLRRSSGAGATVVESSPYPGEAGVAVTREYVVRFSGPLAADAVVTPDRFQARQGGRSILSRVEVSRDRRTATLFHLEPLPASARVTVTFDGAGLQDALGQPLDPDGDGVAGGVYRAEFVTAGSVGLPGTAVVGRIFASERKPDGSNRPLEGVVITVDGAEETLRAVTDAQGAFRLDPAPAGRFFVHVDGRPAVGSQWPTGGYYPFLGKAWEAVAGRTDNPAGGTGEIFLPYIAAEALQAVDPSATTVVTFPPAVLAAHPELAGVGLEVPPNALFNDQGARGGRVGMAPVPPDRLPEPLPPGLNLPLVITIQTDGPQNFDPPVPVRFPNLPDPVTGRVSPPGSKTVLWSFNHDTGRWEPQGLATITADGRHAVTDPGVGVRQPGWHGVAPATSGSGPQGDGRPDGPDCGIYPPNCCLDWEGKKQACDVKEQLALNSAVDLALDNALVALGGPGGCPAGVAAGTARAARDCSLVGMFSDECGGIVESGIYGTVIGCVPGVGGALGLAWGLKGAIDAAVDYRACLGTVVAQCAGASPRALSALGIVRHDPRLERAVEALDAQVRVATAVRQGLVEILGGAVWAGAGEPDGFERHQQFMAAVVGAVAPGSAGGAQITAAERDALGTVPAPPGAGAAETQAFLARMEAIAAGRWRTDPVLRGELASGLDRIVKAVEAVEADGWTDLFDGLRRALAEMLSMYAPEQEAAASGPALASRGAALAGDAAGAGFPRGPLHYRLRDLTSGFVTRGRLSADGRFTGVFLRPGAYYSVAYADAATLRLGATVFRAGPAGENTAIPTAPWFGAGLTSPLGPLSDVDGDGLADRMEEILGTDARKADTDGDGIPDGDEVGEGDGPAGWNRPGPGRGGSRPCAGEGPGGGRGERGGAAGVRWRSGGL